MTPRLQCTAVMKTSTDLDNHSKTQITNNDANDSRITRTQNFAAEMVEGQKAAGPAASRSRE
ncbi:hypothetical protein E2C01_021570 [Portunus trituberculatus]|uniref:Uncharacterized protein n=1 Tax=Portunus trituberculatus TaxID=210409 RepID=A0A5B7E4U6_PORTR|nr:hypothetical protein [Portunus trituberculatus]